MAEKSIAPSKLHNKVLRFTPLPRENDLATGEYGPVEGTPATPSRSISSAKTKRTRGSGHLRLRGRIWWMQYIHRGQVVRESTGTPKRAVAERKLRLRLNEIGTGDLIGPKAEKVLYEELADDLLHHYTINGKKSLVQPKHGSAYVPAEPHLRRFFSGYKIVAVTPSLISQFITARLKAGSANATVNRSLSALKQIFSLALRNKKLRTSDVPIIDMLQERNVRKGFLEPEQYHRLLAALPDHLKPVLSIGYYTGMRLGEIRGLRWEQIDFATGFIRLDPGTTKNDQARAIPITASLREILVFQGKRRDVLHPDCDFVFFTRKGKPIGNFRKAWANACTEADVPGIIFHDLRRTGVRNLVRAGVPERIAMAITGHRTRAVFDRYNIVNETDLTDAGGKLETFLGGGKPNSTPHGGKL